MVFFKKVTCAAREIPSDFKLVILDEIYTYIGKKAKKHYVFTAVGITDLGYKQVFAKIYNENSAWSLVQFLRKIPPAEHYYSDGNPIYGYVLGKKVTAEKSAITNLVESFNSQLRQYLTNIQRKTKAYAKSLINVSHHLELLLSIKFNKQLKI